MNTKRNFTWPTKHQHDIQILELYFHVKFSLKNKWCNWLESEENHECMYEATQTYNELIIHVLFGLADTSKFLRVILLGPTVA